MKYYYLVPVYNEHTFLNDVSFEDMLKLNCPKLYLLEKKRLELYYSLESNYDAYENVSKKIDNIYKWLSIPEYVICVLENGCFHELLTNGVVSSSMLSDLECYEVSKDLASEYYNESNYRDKFIIYYSNYLTYNSNSNINTLSHKKNKE